MEVSYPQKNMGVVEFHPERMYPTKLDDHWHLNQNLSDVDHCKFLSSCKN